MISTSKVNLYIQCLYLLIIQNYLFQMDSIYKYLFTILLILLILMISLI